MLCADLNCRCRLWSGNQKSRNSTDKLSLPTLPTYNMDTLLDDNLFPLGKMPEILNE